MKGLIILTSDGISGGRIVARNLSDVLGFDIFYLVTGQQKQASFEDGKKASPTLRRRFLRFATSIINVKKIIKEGKYKIIITENWISGFVVLALRLSFTFSKKDFLWITRIGRRWNDHPIGLKIPFLFVYLACDKITTPLEKNSLSVTLYMPILGKKITFPCLRNKTVVIPNPIFVPERRIEAFPRRGNILVVGRNVPSKRLPAAINFASRLGEFLATEVHVYTDSAAELRYQFKTAVFFEFVPNFWNNEFESLCMINFALGEGFSMVTAEASTLGIPTISMEGDSGQNDLILSGYRGIILTQRQGLSPTSRDLAECVENLKYQRIMSTSTPSNAQILLSWTNLFSTS